WRLEKPVLFALGTGAHGGKARSLGDPDGPEDCWGFNNPTVAGSTNGTDSGRRGLGSLGDPDTPGGRIWIYRTWPAGVRPEAQWFICSAFGFVLVPLEACGAWFGGLRGQR